MEILREAIRQCGYNPQGITLYSLKIIENYAHIAQTIGIGYSKALRQACKALGLEEIELNAIGEGMNDLYSTYDYYVRLSVKTGIAQNRPIEYLLEHPHLWVIYPSSTYYPDLLQDREFCVKLMQRSIDPFTFDGQAGVYEYFRVLIQDMLEYEAKQALIAAMQTP